ncbi:sensor histidine kinase [Herbiconiux sp. SYSU D00978]|uniref:sensor histidine kinase n=1 Tax=Herbiconiux sp. SYSU D00978 TaxID=2812562 RepID=UPI001A961D81|nr:histidine kinase [Herbiconiux sp. SYSU D00978]
MRRGVELVTAWLRSSVRPLQRYQIAVDVLVAVVFGLVVLPAATVSMVFPLDLLIVLGMVVPLALRRLAPGPALSLAWITALVQMATLAQPQPANLAICGVLYCTAAYGTSRVRWAGLISVGAGAAIGALYITVQGFSISFSNGGVPAVAFGFLAAVVTFVMLAAILGLPWLAGLAVRARVQAAASAEARAVAELGAARAERDVVVEQERNRIAREVHDVVAHSLAVVIAQADGARYASRVDPAVAEDAFATISDTARQSLAEVRSLLAGLRHSDGERPQPVMADIPQLVASLAASGLHVDLQQAGEPFPLGPARQLAVYRIVQEALTNALRHGDPAHPATALFDWRPDELVVEVVNAIAPDSPQPNTLGHGLPGMTERAALVGGRLWAGESDGSFRVHFALPRTNTPTGVLEVVNP